MRITSNLYARIFITSIFFTTLNAAEKVLIFTQVYNRPDFIELHAKTFKAFMQDEYEYVVFNDSNDPSMQRQIEQTCARLGVRCFKIPYNPDSRPGWRHIAGIKYSFETLGFNFDGIVMLVDSDMFLVKPFSANNYMNGYDLIGGEQYRENGSMRVTYIAPTLVLINMKTAPNKRTISFYGGYIEGMACDVGAHMYYYLKNNPTLRYRLFWAKTIGRLPKDAAQLKLLGYDEITIKFIQTINDQYGFEFHGDSHFIHYYAGGSNWPGYSADYLQRKNVIIYNYIDEQMKFYDKLV